MHIRRIGRRLGWVALPAALSLTVAGCGSSGTGTGTGSGSRAASGDEAALGTPNPATGSPITIGVISDGKSAQIDDTDEYKGAEAAAAYANAYLGGISGHKIVVKLCQSLTDPATSTDCANQMVTAKVSAVVEGTLAAVDQTVSVLSAAKIPLAMNSASTQLAMTSPHVYSLSNGLALFGAAAAQAKKLGVKKADLVVIGVPAAVGPARDVGAALFKKEGIDLTITALPPGTADMTPQISSAAAGHPELYHVFGSPSFCTPALQAIKTVDPKAKVMAISQCLSDAGASTIPGGYAGIQVLSASDLDPENPETKLFDAVMARYGDGGQASIHGAQGYSPMLGFIRALNAAKVSGTTPAAIDAAIKSAPPTLYPLGAGGAFQCNGKQMAIAPNVCSSTGIMATAKADGTLSDYQLIPSDPELYSLPAAG